MKLPKTATLWRVALCALPALAGGCGSEPEAAKERSVEALPAVEAERGRRPKAADLNARHGVGAGAALGAQERAREGSAEGALREVETIFAEAKGKPNEAARKRALELLEGAGDSPLVDFYFGESLRLEARTDANLAVEVFERYHRAAVGRVPEAAFRVGVCLETGAGAPVDLVQAMNWHRFAAEEGVVPAQVALAHAYHCGMGVPKSDVAALTWLYLCGGLENPALEELKKEIFAGVTRDEAMGAILTAPVFVNYELNFEVK